MVATDVDQFLYLNGSIVPASEARISPLDRGLLYGDGLFETMRSYGGRIHLLLRHLERLQHGARFLGIVLPESEVLMAALRQVVDANGGGDMILRLTVTRGVGGGPHDRSVANGPTLLIVPRPCPEPIDEPERIITLDIVHTSPGYGKTLKSLNYLTAIVAAPQLQAGGVREGITMTRDGWVAEGTVSNIFCVRDGVLLTPSLDAGILPGITRGRLLEIARAGEIDVREERIAHADLVSSDEVFYTNSAREIVPVRQVDAIRIGTGTAGPVTRELAARYRAEAPHETI